MKQSHPEANPWKKTGTKIIYSNPWMTVREDAVIRPDGTPGTYSVIEKCAATGVVALTPQNEVYLVGQYRYPIDIYSWEIIEGGAEPNENPLAAVKRELREEAGLEADEWQQLGAAFYLSNCISSEIAYLYLARGLREVPSAPESTEVLQVKKLPIEECVRLVETGEISDGMSVVGILRVARLLGV